MSHCLTNKQACVLLSKARTLAESPEYLGTIKAAAVGEGGL